MAQIQLELRNALVDIIEGAVASLFLVMNLEAILEYDFEIGRAHV